MVNAGDLIEALKTVCPVDSVSILDAATKKVDIAFAKTATAQQISNAQALLASMDLMANSSTEIKQDNAKAARARLAARSDFDKLPDWAQDICIALGLR